MISPVFLNTCRIIYNRIVMSLKILYKKQPILKSRKDINMVKFQTTENAVETRIKNQKLVRKKHLLIASKATKLFIKKGFSNTSMRDISRVTKITLGNLYSYIKRKEDILCLVFDLYHKTWVKTLEKNGVMEIDDPEQQIRRAVRAMMEFGEQYQDEIKLMHMESRFLPKEFLAVAKDNEKQLVNAFENMIRRGVERGIFRVEDPFFSANMLVFEMSLNSLRGWNLRDKYNYDEIVRMTENYILDTLKKPA